MKLGLCKVFQKQGQEENFKELVRECAGPVNLLSRVRIENFTERAQTYVCTYHYLDQKFEKAYSAAASVPHPTIATIISKAFVQ